MKTILLAFLFLFTAHGLRFHRNGENPRLLLISFDGFRAKYLYDHHLRNFEKFMGKGVFAKVKSAFPTITFPNHYSIATGLTGEHHGIVGNVMYDKFMNATFDPSCCGTDNRWWQQNPNVMPIWIANELAGNNRRSGTIGFVGSLSTICGKTTFKSLAYSDSRPFKKIIDTMVEWFTDSHEPINFMAIYFYEPDKTGHRKGPESPEVKSKLQECDQLLAYIEERMSEKDIWEETNVIIATDHGMTSVDPMNKSIVLEKYIDLSKCIVKSSLSFANIYAPDINTVVSIQKNLTGIPHYKAYFRENVPAEFFYSKNIRIGDVVFLPEPGYLVFETEIQRNSTDMHGAHGYNNSDPDMLGMFMARGPAINENQKDRDWIINIVDIYALMTEILEIPRREIDGNYSAILKFLNHD